MSLAEQLAYDPFCDEEFWGEVRRSGVETFGRRQPETTCLSTHSAHARPKVVADVLRGMSYGSNLRAGKTFEPGEAIDINHLSDSSKVYFERQYLTVIGALTREAAHAALWPKAIVKPGLMAIKSESHPWEYPDYENGRHYAFAYEVQSGFGVVLPSDDKGNQGIFGIKKEITGPSPPKVYGAGTGFSAVIPGSAGRESYRYESLEIPYHTPAITGLSTMVQHNHGNLSWTRIERINTLEVYKAK